MAEPIKAKLVLDVASGGAGTDLLGGFANAIESALGDLDLQVLGDIGAIVGGLVLAVDAGFKALKAGVNKIVESSPRLKTSIEILFKGLSLLLRPIGDIMSFFVKPLAIALLRFAIPIYKLWRAFLESPAAVESLEQIDTGVGQVVQGIISLDFDQVKAGFTNVIQGGLGLLEAFGATFSENISLTDLKDRFLTFLFDAAVFFKDTLLSLLTGLGKLIGILPDDAEITGFKDLLLNTVQGVVQGIFDTIQFQTMTDNLVAALRASSPLFMLLESLLGAGGETQYTTDALQVDPATDQGSPFEAIDDVDNKKLAETKGLFEQLMTFTGTTGTQIQTATKELGFFDKIALALGETAVKVFTGESGLNPQLNQTEENLNIAQQAVNALIQRLDAVPRVITTTHYIKTVRI